jgi:hypothetical protein
VTAAHQVLTTLRTHGPQRTTQLERRLGLTRRQVHHALGKLAEAGYVVASLNPAGSHRGGLYCLVSSPGHVSCDRKHCIACGCVLARDHAGSVLCSPCESRCVDWELAMLHQPTLEEVMTEAGV